LFRFCSGCFRGGLSWRRSVAFSCESADKVSPSGSAFRSGVGAGNRYKGETTHPRALTAYLQPKSVMLYFVDPFRAGRRSCGLCRPARFHESGRAPVRNLTQHSEKIIEDSRNASPAITRRGRRFWGNPAAPVEQLKSWPRGLWWVFSANAARRPDDNAVRMRSNKSPSLSLMSALRVNSGTDNSGSPSGNNHMAAR